MILFMQQADVNHFTSAQSPLLSLCWSFKYHKIMKVKQKCIYNCQHFQMFWCKISLLKLAQSCSRDYKWGFDGFDPLINVIVIWSYDTQHQLTQTKVADCQFGMIQGSRDNCEQLFISGQSEGGDQSYLSQVS